MINVLAEILAQDPRGVGVPTTLEPGPKDISDDESSR